MTSGAVAAGDGQQENKEKKKGSTLTEEEAALYDRQIRLWGLESQKHLRATKVCSRTLTQHKLTLSSTQTIF